MTRSHGSSSGVAAWRPPSLRRRRPTRTRCGATTSRRSAPFESVSWKEHLATAEAAKTSSDWISASNAYRLALQVIPDDAAIQELLAEVQVKANSMLAESYRKQASYEEKSGRSAEASRSWQRVARAVPDDAEAHGRAAACMLRAGIDLRTAATLAPSAPSRSSPPSSSIVSPSARRYLAAGLSLNATRELEAAARLAPDDANIEALLKRAGKR